MYTFIVGSFFIMFLLGTALGRELLFGVVTEAFTIQSPEVLATVTDVSQETLPTPSDSLTETPSPSPIETQTILEVDTEKEVDTPTPEETLTPKPSIPFSITLTTALSPTLTLTPTQTPTAALTSSPTQTPVPTATLSPFISAKFIAPAYLEPMFDQYANQYHVDGQLLRKIASCESHYNTGVVGGGGLYAGMFQFAVGSWQSIRSEMGQDPNPDLRFGANESIQTAAYALSLGKASMWPTCSK